MPRHIASGFYVGSSNQNGVCLIGYKSPNGRAPDALLVSVGPWDSDNAKGMGVMVWDAGPQAAQVRLMNTRTGEFGGTWPVQFSWIAIWNS